MKLKIMVTIAALSVGVCWADTLADKAAAGDAQAQYLNSVRYMLGDEVPGDAATAAQWARQAAEQGNAEAQLLLGEAYRYGVGVEQCEVQAAEWYHRAAEQGNAEAQAAYGVMLAQGKGVAQDASAAVEWYRKAAEQGNTRAQYNLYNAYTHGKGVQKDGKQAHEWLQKAAKGGNAMAEGVLGVSYVFGVNGEANEIKGLQLLQHAAELGDAPAQANMGRLYERGRKVDWDGSAKNHTEAAKWYEMAAKQGFAKAQVKMAIFWSFYGGDAEYNALQAADWYRRAALQNDPEGLFGLGWCYEKGKGVEQNMERALCLYHRAADAGDIKAMLRLAWAYGSGAGLPVDLVEKVRWEMKAAKRGNGDALYYVGRAYLRGEGLPQDDAKGAQYMRRSALQGSPRAFWYLGRLMETGRGVPMSAHNAYGWYRKTADEPWTYPQALHTMGRLRFLGIVEPQNKAAAVEDWKVSAQKGYTWAQNDLGVCYELGEGVTADAEEAARRYSYATEGDDAYGAYNLARCYEFGIGVERRISSAVACYAKAVEGGVPGAAEGLARVVAALQKGETTDAAAAPPALFSFHDGRNEVDDDIRPQPTEHTVFDTPERELPSGFAIQDDMGITPAKSAAEMAAEDMAAAKECMENGREKQAIERLNHALERGNKNALLHLALCYYRGLGVEKDAAKAQELLERARRCGAWLAAPAAAYIEYLQAAE